MLDVRSWSGVSLIEPVSEGSRNEVWRATNHGEPVAVRCSRRSDASLQWEIELTGFLATRGFLVPTVVPTDDGRPHADGVIVQRWIEGRPPTSITDWAVVAEELQRLHSLTGDHPQRPGCCIVTALREHRMSVDADLDAVPSAAREIIEAVFAGFARSPTAVVHGDPGASNIRITDEGRVGLLDWDESRVDVTWHDLSNLGVTVLQGNDHERAQSLSDAWEAANAWTTEPDYAATRLDRLLQRRR